jgi:hypothetical protein
MERFNGDRMRADLMVVSPSSAADVRTVRTSASARPLIIPPATGLIV